MNSNTSNSTTSTTALADIITSVQFRRWLWIAGVVVVIAGSAWFGYRYFGANGDSGARPGAAGNRQRFTRNGPAPVIAVAARKIDMDVFINGLGTVIPLNTVTVRSRVDGELTHVLFKEGQSVKAGDLLAQIDPRAFAVQEAQASGQAARDRALLKNAQLDLERYKTLLAQDSIAAQQLDTQGALVQQYEAAVKIDESQIDNAKLQLSYTHVTAPISGRLGLKQVDQGNIIRAGDVNGLVVITQLKPIAVVFPVPEDNFPIVLRHIQNGESLAVEAWDRSGKTKLATGELSTADNQVDITTGTIKLKARFPNDDESLFSNQFVNIRLRIDTLHDATVVPIPAVQQGTQGPFVYVVNDEHVLAMRVVKIGPADSTNVVITEGLRPGETVVAEGSDRLRDGAKVEPIAPPNESAPPPTPKRKRGDGPRGKFQPGAFPPDPRPLPDGPGGERPRRQRSDSQRSDKTSDSKPETTSENKPNRSTEHARQEAATRKDGT